MTFVWKQGVTVRKEVAERSCCICAKDVLENEEHVLLDCFPYEPLRRKCLPQFVIIRQALPSGEIPVQGDEMLLN